MSNTDRTPLGDRMKAYEYPSTSRVAFKGQPLMARLDGKSFHTFTKGLKRPYDERLTRLMIDTTKELVDRYSAAFGYTQSDEITLSWYVPSSSQSEYPFNGRMQKLESILAGLASAYFTSRLTEYLPEKKGAVPCFDARAWVMPNLTEVANNLIWRQQDATRNAISMAAQSMFSHNSLFGLSGAQMQERMWQEKGVNFNDYPFFFKRGTFVRREKVFKELTPEILARIPVDRRPTGPIERTEIKELDIWLTKQEDAVEVLFNGADIIHVASPELPTGTGWDKPLFARMSGQAV